VVDRRALLKSAVALPMASAFPGITCAADPSEADYTLRIATVALELAPGKTIKTTGYNGQVPGPALRLREGKPVKMKVINEAAHAPQRTSARPIR